jgi:phospholipase C
VYDHTSTIRLMEQVFGVEEPNISAWRRRTCGDLTATLNIRRGPARSFPALPETRNYLLNQYVTSQDQPAPAVPSNQTMPVQEPGTRPHVP